MTCIRPKKFGKCIYEETCYGYHPYKEPGYKRTKEEIFKERKDELIQKYDEEYKSLESLIKKFRCPVCGTFKKELKYHLLLSCEHIICSKCFKGKKKCPKCNQKFNGEKEGEDFILLDIGKNSIDIDTIMKKNYEKKKEEEKNAENIKNKIEKKDEKEEDKKEETKKDPNKDSKNNEDNDSETDPNTSI